MHRHFLWNQNWNGRPIDLDRLWFIDSVEHVVSPDKPTTLVDGIVSGGLSGHALWRNTLAEDSLMEHLGDIRLLERHPDGLWIRGTGSRARLHDAYDFKLDARRYELGYDRSVPLAKGRALWGLSLNWSNGKADLRKGTARTKSAGLALYHTRSFENGWYVDASGARYRSTEDRFAFSLSGEVGRNIELSGGVFLRPEAQLTFGRLGGKRFTTSNGVEVDAGAIDSLISRTGLKAGIVHTAGGRGSVHLKTDLLREWMGRDVVRLAYGGDTLEVPAATGRRGAVWDSEPTTGSTTP